MIYEIPRELFSISEEEREYKFINLEGKEEAIVLGSNSYLLPKKCSLDGTNLVMVSDGYNWIEHCYCCGGPYFDMNSEGEQYKKAIEEYSQKLQKEIKKTREKLTKLEKLSFLINNRDSEIFEKNKENSMYPKKRS